MSMKNTQGMMKIYISLMEWKSERLLTIEQQRDGYLTNLFEEIGELGEGIRNKNEHEIVDALCDITVFATNSFSMNDLNSFLSYMNVYVVNNEFSIESLVKQAIDISEAYHIRRLVKLLLNIDKHFRETLGYDYFKCMDEVLKELNSRVGSYNPEIGKWVKDKSPEAQEKWYKADFSKCKL